MLDVNLKGPFRLTAMVGARMAAGAGGSIIMVSSTSAIRPTANVIPYAAAKAARQRDDRGLRPRLRARPCA